MSLWRIWTLCQQSQFQSKKIQKKHVPVEETITTIRGTELLTSAPKGDIWILCCAPLAECKSIPRLTLCRAGYPELLALSTGYRKRICGYGPVQSPRWKRAIAAALVRLKASAAHVGFRRRFWIQYPVIMDIHQNLNGNSDGGNVYISCVVIYALF